MRILCACEESQTVTKALRKSGHEAYSCDIQSCSGGHPEWHFQQDVTELLKQDWDAVIAFPPCTHLAVSGARHFAQKIADGRQQEGIDFFTIFTKLDHIPIVIIENPIGIMSKIYRKPDQIVQPYEYGHSVQKSTCLWLKGVEKLKPTKIVDKGKFITYASGKKMHEWYSITPENMSRQKGRSVFWTGVANAMCDQWFGNVRINEKIDELVDHFVGIIESK